MAKDKKTDDLTRLIALLRRNGISRLKNAEIEIELHPSAFFPETAYQLKKKAKDPAYKEVPESHSVANAEAALFWSSSQVPGGIQQ